MQTLYHVVLLSDCLEDPSTAAWLVHAGVSLPGEIPSGRYPTPAELQAVIDAIPGIRAVYTISDAIWQVTVTSRSDVFWATLAVREYAGDPDTAHPFYFIAGWDELIQLITSHLATRCGPLVLLHDSGALPQVVM